ncbi:hypothetical protein DY000_02023491 [Brassica cretica]|uniref:Uncharacterized protein n=1 Tax=Brassica cretica TaxID=69181 RepID=A0ABQ7E7E8_BRACR|nr:hypothetical protein DY000_02023491 [Brassica cretica]
MEKDCVDLLASAAVPDWSISEFDLPRVSDDLVDQIGGSSGPDDSVSKYPGFPSFRDSFVWVVGISQGVDLYKAASYVLGVQTRTGVANTECIRSADTSDALTEVLREETRLPRSSSQGTKDPEGETYVARVKSSSLTGSDGRDRPPKKAKTNGSDRRLVVSNDTAVAKPFHWQFSHSKDCPITEDPDSVAHLEVVANIDLLTELKDRGLTVDAELARLKEMEKDCVDLLASAAVPDWSISEFDLPQVSDDLVDQIGGSSGPDDSVSKYPGFPSFRDSFVWVAGISRGVDLYKAARVRTRTCVANTERIRSGDASDALTEVLREETRLPRSSSQGTKDPEGETYVARVKSSSLTGSDGRDRPPKKAKTNGSDRRLVVSNDTAVAKPFHWQFSHSKDCPITEDPDSVAHLVRRFKPAGCPLPSLRNMSEREAYVKMAVAHAKAMEANNEFAATLERCLQDVPRSDELSKIKKVVRELKLGPCPQGPGSYLWVPGPYPRVWDLPPSSRPSDFSCLKINSSPILQPPWQDSTHRRPSSRTSLGEADPGGYYRPGEDICSLPHVYNSTYWPRPRSPAHRQGHSMLIKAYRSSMLPAAYRLLHHLFRPCAP